MPTPSNSLQRTELINDGVRSSYDERYGELGSHRRTSHILDMEDEPGEDLPTQRLRVTIRRIIENYEMWLTHSSPRGILVLSPQLNWLP
jgi:hypothetical protein